MQEALPPSYRILPFSIDFRVPGFESFSRPWDKALSVGPRDSAEWFADFSRRIIESVGRRYLPVCRMSDGEFLFCLGPQPPDPRLSWGRRTRLRASRLWGRLRRRGFWAATGSHYRSGTYTNEEWQQGRSEYGRWIRHIAEKGILALHLTYGVTPFQEHYFPALGRWLETSAVRLDADNYVPFYFVYALLAGPQRLSLLKGRRVLLVNGASPMKRSAIDATLRAFGVAETFWHGLSADRSLFDRLDLTPFQGKVDLVLVGAGIGKPQILLQLEPLRVPCIDAGYMLEVWADPRLASERPFCLADAERKS